MNEPLRKCVFFTHGILRQYIIIHDKIFAPPKGIIGKIHKIFNPMDFGSYMDILTDLNTQLKDSRSEIENM